MKKSLNIAICLIPVNIQCFNRLNLKAVLQGDPRLYDIPFLRRERLRLDRKRALFVESFSQS